MKKSFHRFRFQQKKFLALVARNFGAEDQKKLVRAFKFARLSHQGQRRAEGGGAYIIHPVRVAVTLLETVGTWDADVAAAALLHDVVEDCKVSLSTIERRFGKRIALFVRAVTSKRPKRESEEEKEKRKTRKLSWLNGQPLEVRLIKCADVLDNLRCSADIPWWIWTPLARKKFPRWHREFHQAVEFAKKVHPGLFNEMQKALRVFDLKRVARGVVRMGR